MNSGGTPSGGDGTLADDFDGRATIDESDDDLAVSAAPDQVGSARPTTEPEIADRGSLGQRLLRAGAVDLVADGLAIVSLVILLASGPTPVAVLLALVALAAPLVLNTRNLRALRAGEGPTGSGIFARAVLALSVVRLPEEPDILLAVGAAILAALVVLERPNERIARGAIPYAANLPGVSVRSRALVPVGRLYVVNAAAILAAGVLAAVGAPGVVVLLLAVLAAIPNVLAAVDGVRRIQARRVAERSLPGLLRRHAPTFALHWDAPPGTEYQVTMWLPYLERLGKPFLVVVRNPRTFDAIAAVTSAPVLLRREPRDLDAIVVPSLKAVFYVNNAMRNSHMVRYAGVKHIQLNHGESDKAPSYSPVFRMFDKNFVAGEAAIDRFARHGIELPEGHCVVVGRPQIEHISVGSRIAQDSGAVVLYAPTWAGHNQDSSYSSLPIGEQIIRALLARGCTVYYRPHPYTDRSPQHAAASRSVIRMLKEDAAATGRRHRVPPESTAQLSLTECFNAADALISDVSSVVPDFLFSEKPFAVAAMTSSVEEFESVLPIAEAGYVLSRDGRNIPEVLDTMLGTDPRVGRRKALKSYYLGPFPHATYAEGFLDAARRYV